MSTDTRAALERELRDNADWLALGARQGMELSHREVADLAEVLTQAADFLARSAPKERGEGERLVYQGRPAWEVVADWLEGAPAVTAWRNGEVTTRQFAALLNSAVLAHVTLASPPAPVEIADALGGMVGPDAEDRASSARIMRAHSHTVYTPAPVEGERERIADSIAEDLFVNGAGQRARRLVLELEDGRNGGGWCRGAVVDRIRDALASHPVQGAGGGEREVVQWPRGYTVRIAVEALEGVSVCASLSEQDPDGAWVVIHEVTELPTVDAALRALASGEPAPPPLPQRMECPYCLAVWRPHSVADAECCPSCLRDLPRLAPPSAQRRDG